MRFEKYFAPGKNGEFRDFLIEHRGMYLSTDENKWPWCLAKSHALWITPEMLYGDIDEETMKMIERGLQNIESGNVESFNWDEFMRIGKKLEVEPDYIDALKMARKLIDERPDLAKCYIDTAIKELTEE